MGFAGKGAKGKFAKGKEANGKFANGQMGKFASVAKLVPDEERERHPLKWACKSVAFYVTYCAYVVKNQGNLGTIFTT